MVAPGRGGRVGHRRHSITSPPNVAGPAPFGTGPFSMRTARVRDGYGTLTEVLSPLLLMVNVPEALEV